MDLCVLGSVVDTGGDPLTAAHVLSGHCCEPVLNTHAHHAREQTQQVPACSERGPRLHMRRQCGWTNRAHSRSGDGVACQPSKHGSAFMPQSISKSSTPRDQMSAISGRCCSLSIASGETKGIEPHAPLTIFCASAARPKSMRVA